MMQQKNPKNRKTIVAIFAHPDDESFGPSGTIAKFAKDNDVYVLCATKGESGMGLSSNLAATRAKELRDSAKILGVKNVFFLGFIDGTLSNSIYHKLASKIEQRLKLLKPEILITVEPRGVSGHIDHITVSMVTSFIFAKLPFVKTLMYYCIDQKAAAKMANYFIYFPPGYKRSEVDKIIDVTKYWPQKIEAMLTHKSQIKDARKVLGRIKGLPKEEYFFIKTK
jgi:LmbE family N-acetylglucosaminyl deacetylase